MSKAATLIFALIAYAIFFATFLYLIAFVGDFSLVPRSVDRGPEASVAVAIVIDSALIALFGLQHSIMARPAFKRAWTRFVPAQSERSLFVLFASLALILLFAFWRPIGGTLWSVEAPAGQALLWTIFGLGWGLLGACPGPMFALFGAGVPAILIAIASAMAGTWVYAVLQSRLPH